MCGCLVITTCQQRRLCLSCLTRPRTQVGAGGAALSSRMNEWADGWLNILLFLLKVLEFLLASELKMSFQNIVHHYPLQKCHVVHVFLVKTHENKMTWCSFKENYLYNSNSQKEQTTVIALSSHNIWFIVSDGNNNFYFVFIQWCFCYLF